MNDRLDAAVAVAQKFDPRTKFQPRSELIALIFDYLREGECPEGGIFALRGRAIGFLWATNERLFYAGRTELPIFRFPVFMDHSYDKILSIDAVVKKSFLGVITIKVGDDRTEYTVTPSLARIDDFVALVQKKIFTVATAQTRSQSDDLVTQLERLARLRQQEMLTEEEYKTAKAKLLNS